jgi:steroid delta-isomerase-like uncharacterized protein
MWKKEEYIALLHPLLSQWLNAFNSHDVAAIVALYTEDAELFDSGMRRPRHGRKEIEQWFSTRFSSMPTISYNPTGRVFMEERQAAMTWTTRGYGPRLLGQAWLVRPFAVDGVSVFTLCDGLIQKQRGYYDHLSALEQILPLLKWILPRRF